jgi:class 3 adenylate cyclase/tetratricopeptide (TPR) repeat protein
MSQVRCERCGEPLPEGARFCPNCGFPVGAPPAEERKVVTVVFVDLVGSTRLSAQIDPERYREVIAAYYQVTTEEMESLRGRAYNFAGDAVVGVFGIPHAHDDDALRAIRAGLSIVERIGRLGEELGLPLRLRCRVGVNTGPVAVGTESADRGLLFGAVVNAAARLQQAAEPGSVIAGETTWVLTKDVVEYGARSDLDAKGFESGLAAWPVVALAPRSSRRTIPFVDRRREVRLLHETYERAIEARRGHMVTLFGEPGIGKSRVVDEFLAGLPEDARALVGRASPFEEDVTFAPIAQILLQELGERQETPVEHLRSRLEQVVLECCPTDQVHETVVRLGMALGVGDEAREERRYRVAEIRAGLLSLLEGLSAQGPVVLVFEDLHLAEPTLLDLVEQTVREAKRVPLLVVCVARYDLLDERPDWGGGLGDSLNLYLEPMPVDDAIELALEAGEGLDHATAERIARHAGGNPFFIIETTGMLMHEEAQLVAGDTGPIPEQLLPPTVQAVIAARIDHLPLDARELVRRASVFPRAAFHLSELALVAEPDERVLDVLEDEELLMRDEERPDARRFRHGLVRDVAYESLPKRERQRLHLRVADRLSDDPATARRYPRSIAYHLEQAARAALDLDPSNRELADRAAQALAKAGDLALEASDARAAADLFERALAMTGPEKTWGAPEAFMLSHLGEARYWLGDFETAESPLGRALEIGGGVTEIRAHANRFLADIELSIRGDREAASARFETALAAARELGDPRTLARTLLVAGWAPYWRGDIDGARAMFEEALAVTRDTPGGDPWAESRALVALANLVSEIGDEEETLGLASQALAIGEATGDRFAIAVARESVGNSLRRMLRLDDALSHLEQAVDAFRELGARWELASSLTSRGITHRLAGRREVAVRDLREAYRLCRELKERSIVSWTATAFIKALAESGDAKTARQVLAEMRSFVRPKDPLTSREWLLEAEMSAWAAEGDRDAALERGRALLAVVSERERPKDRAALVWLVGRLFGSEAVGGAEEVERAHELLSGAHWEQALLEPDLWGKPWTST